MPRTSSICAIVYAHRLHQPSRRHVVYDSKNSRRSNTYGGSLNASIAKLGLKNGPSMIKDEVRVDDFCRQTVLNRFATSFSYDLPYQKLDKVQSNSNRI
ncbi:MAG: hypothetical protein WA220_04190 [Candidatus Nitrosopolaris sp.]